MKVKDDGRGCIVILLIVLAYFIWASFNPCWWVGGC